MACNGSSFSFFLSFTLFTKFSCSSFSISLRFFLYDTFLACDCNVNGSVRSDCEQMTGRCVCKPGVLGIKCDECPSGRILTVYGCTDESIFRPVPKSCSQMVCLFGARCREMKDRATTISSTTTTTITTSKDTTNSFTTSTSTATFNRSSNNASPPNSLLTTQVTSNITTRAQCVCDGLCDPLTSPSLSNSLHSTLPSLVSYSSPSIDVQSGSSQQAMLQDERQEQQLPKPLVLTSLSNVNNGNKNLLSLLTPDPSVMKSLSLSPWYVWWYKRTATFHDSDHHHHKQSLVKRDTNSVTSEVCGSNGITYASECELRLHSCRIQESIIVISKGPCKSKLHPCFSFFFTHLQTCIYNKCTFYKATSCPCNHNYDAQDDAIQIFPVSIYFTYFIQIELEIFVSFFHSN